MVESAVPKRALNTLQIGSKTSVLSIPVCLLHTSVFAYALSISPCHLHTLKRGWVQDSSSPPAPFFFSIFLTWIFLPYLHLTPLLIFYCHLPFRFLKAFPLKGKEVYLEKTKLFPFLHNLCCAQQVSCFIAVPMFYLMLLQFIFSLPPPPALYF